VGDDRNDRVVDKVTPEEYAAFLAERKTGIGGSDVHHLFDLPPWGCRRRLMYDKLGALPDYPPNDLPVFERGRVLEPIVREKYARMHACEVEQVPMLRHRGYTWAIVHLDGLVSAKKCVLEIKVLGRETYHDYRKNGLPDSYIMQLHYGAWIADMERGAFAIFNPDLWTDPLTWEVELDMALIADIVDAGDAFWAMRKRQELPPRLEADSEQCYRCPWRLQCQGEHLLEIVRQKGGTVPFDVSIADLVAAYEEAKTLRKDAEDLEAVRRIPLEEALGDRSIVETIGYKVNFSVTKGRVMLKEDLVKKLLAELKQPTSLVEKCKQQGNPYRTLRIYEAKG
jgi:hypothetical protein